MACGYGACYGCAVQPRRPARPALRRGPRRRRRAPGGGVSADLSTRVGAVALAAPGHERLGHARPAGRARRRPRGRRRARAARHQDRHAARARGQRGAARGRGRGRHAQLDRPAQPRPRGVRRRRCCPRCARSAARSSSRSAASSTPTTSSPAGALEGEPGHRRARAQRLVPERQERLHLDRQRSRPRPRRSCASAAPRPACRCGSSSRPTSPTSPRSRARPSAAAPMRSCSRTRCAASRSTTGRWSRCSAASRAGSPGPALKPVALAAVHTCRAACALPDRRRRGHRERVGCARVPRRGRERRAGRERRVPRAAARPPRPRGTRHPTRRSAGSGRVSAVKTTTLD